ncbi:MATE efflux family protein [Candidatus Vecturithrix granuli]|uniref:MATE efflux family protein n=1 Tax=Vecturithrix granuli TaxID=1499967 RepID=A0A081C672_VECG1|nr:MATE efflux family protein [Candidatus Vecturithrix granuli]
MKDTKKAQLIEGSIAKTLFNLTIPMMLGMLGMSAFNLTDTYFVGQLGTRELAAMSFTFPVVMIISSLAHGLGIGVSAVVSRAIGEGDQKKVQRLTTDSLVLSLLLVVSFVATGLLTITPLFRFLGATPEILPLIERYMRVWYLGMIAVVIPMVGNSATRATGDTKTPGMIMLVAVFVNIILDPLFIFGIGPFPRLEIVGAALATVFGRTITLCVALWVLIRRDKMITFERPSLNTLLQSWKHMLYIGLPTAGTNMLLPISAGIITKLIATYGPAAVAGFGVATRVEMFALLPVMALSSVLGPFIGQNWGAKKYERVWAGSSYSHRFSIGWGLGMFLLLAFSGKFIASLFNPDPVVISTAATYLWIVPLGYGAQGGLRLSTIALTVLHKPLRSALITLVQAFILHIPLAYLGSQIFDLKGVFSAAVMSYLIAALIAYWWLKNSLATEQGIALSQQLDTRVIETL